MNLTGFSTEDKLYKNCDSLVLWSGRFYCSVVRWKVLLWYTPTASFKDNISCHCETKLEISQIPLHLCNIFWIRHSTNHVLSDRGQHAKMAICFLISANDLMQMKWIAGAMLMLLIRYSVTAFEYMFKWYDKIYCQYLVLGIDTNVKGL